MENQKIVSKCNDNQEVFTHFRYGQKYTKNSIREFFKMYEKKCDLHFTEYWYSQSDDNNWSWLEKWEEFIVVWKDAWTCTASYTWYTKASFVLDEVIWDIEVFECIYVK